MNLTTTVFFYLLLGVGVAVAVHLAVDAASERERWFRTLSAVLFWPLYVPALLQKPVAASPEAMLDGQPTGAHQQATLEPCDSISMAIGQVEAELDLALHSLDGWSDAVLAREQHRFEELRAAWHAQAARIRELDGLLAQPMFAVPGNARADGSPVANAGERVAKSEEARRANIARLRAVRQRLHDDLMNTLAWVRELVTMIHLAKYTGAPASRAEELVMQIATCVEGLSEVAAWRDGVPERQT